jgi:hypothetical protein
LDIEDILSPAPRKETGIRSKENPLGTQDLKVLGEEGLQIEA